MASTPKPVALAAAALGAAALLALYLGVSLAPPAAAEVTRYSSGIYDMDVSRVVADLTSDRRAYRPGVHPLQKLLAAPLGRGLNARLFGGRDRLAAAKLLIAFSMTLTAVGTGWLAAQLARGSAAAGLCAGLLFGASFSSLLAATIPESAALASLGSVAPLLLLGARWDRPLGWGEAVGWGLLGVFGLAFTVTQLAHWAIALGVRVWRALGTPALL